MTTNRKPIRTAISTSFNTVTSTMHLTADVVGVASDTVRSFRKTNRKELVLDAIVASKDIEEQCKSLGVTPDQFASFEADLFS